jgi:hypothetical protein
VGTLRADGSLDADAVHSGIGGRGLPGLRHGHGPGRGFDFRGFGLPDGQADPYATATPSATAS